MVTRIVKDFHPEKIILFGSHARGERQPTMRSGVRQ
jgi:predicted nucleotidyltransferase